MFAKLIAALLAAATWCVAAGAWANSENDAAPRGLALDCEHLPGSALKRLPPPFDTWARLDCLPSGQLLAPARNWVWRYPASFTTPVFVPAWTPDPSAAAEGGRYFTSAEVAVARGEQAIALNRRLAGEVEVYAGMTEGRPDPSAVYTLMAENDLGQSFEVHFLYRSDQDVWGIVCAPKCRSEFSFLVSSRGN